MYLCIHHYNYKHSTVTAASCIHVEVSLVVFKYIFVAVYYDTFFLSIINCRDDFSLSLHNSIIHYAALVF